MSSIDWKQRVEYSEESPSGLVWKTSGPNSTKGGSVGYIRTSKRGVSRWQTMIGRKSYLCHRLVWELFNGEIPKDWTIDHLDQNPLNNKISNLRCVPNEINVRNKGKYRNSTSGITGISFWVSRNGDEYVCAQWQDLDSNRCGKKFQIKKYGRDEAIRLATEYRDEQIRLLNELGAGYTDRHGT